MWFLVFVGLGVLAAAGGAWLRRWQQRPQQVSDAKRAELQEGAD